MTGIVERVPERSSPATGEATEIEVTMEKRQ